MLRTETEDMLEMLDYIKKANEELIDCQKEFEQLKKELEQSEKEMIRKLHLLPDDIKSKMVRNGRK